MNVLLINVAFNIYGGVKGHGGTMMPLNLCYLAAYARQQHADVRFRILDAEIQGLTHEQTVEEAALYHPDLIGITANTCVFDSVIKLVILLKNRFPDALVMIGGPHPSAMPEQSLRDSLADFAVVGEGEITFAEVIAQLRAKDDDWSKINGLVFRDVNGEIHINEPRALIKDLDTLPFPARDIINNKAYSPAPTKRVGLGPNTLIATSRGCPFRCGFCAAQAVWTRRIRTREPLCVVAEMKECVEKYGIRSFNFTDEFFTSDKNRVLAICGLICERKLNVAWVCSARAQHLDKETLLEMKRSGCHEISFGIESGNPDILKSIDKSIDLSEMYRVVSLAKSVGIITHASYILGYMGETVGTMRDTVRFAKHLNTDVAAFFIASPLPGSSLYKIAEEIGCLRANASWIDYSPLSNTESVLQLPNLSTSQIRSYHRKALRSYYLRPRYIFSRLKRIRHFYEVINLLAGLKIFMMMMMRRQ